MTEKQKLLLQLFREVDAICKKHDLRYVMAGGTLIGVLRNEGFIPWDDDVDIYMPKSDWDKFVEICQNEMPPNRAVYCAEVDRNYTNGFPRYGSTDTCAIHKHQIIGDDKAGEIIDVLTLDPIPDDDREYEKYRDHMMIYTELLNISMVVGVRWEISPWRYLYWLFRYTFCGKDRTLKKLEKIMFSYKEEECSRYAMRWGGCPFLFDKDMMFPVKYMDFEGEKVMIPHRTSDYLIWHYGDEWPIYRLMGKENLMSLLMFRAPAIRRCGMNIRQGSTKNVSADRCFSANSTAFLWQRETINRMTDEEGSKPVL